ncbi:hypothetical protein Tco_0768685 [Tanacetum coccineum]
MVRSGTMIYLEEEPAPTGETSALPAPKTAKQLAAKRNQKECLDHSEKQFKSSLEAMKKAKEDAENEDIEPEGLRSLPPSWNQIALIMRNKPDIDEIDIDDLYNNLRVYEDEIKRSSSSTSTSQNLAFLSSENTSSTNEVSTASGDFGVSTAGGTSQVSLPHIDEDDLEELDLRWQVAMLTVRVGYDTQLNAMSNNSETDSEISLSVFDVRSSDEESTPANDRFSKAYGYHAVPPLITGNFLTARADISFADDEDDVSEKQGIGFKKIKACFVCKSTDHLIKDCNFHDKQSQEPKMKTVVNTGPRVDKPVWDNTKRAKMRKSSSQKFSTARPLVTARPGNPEILLQNHAVVDSGCFNHMTGNKTYLSDYEDYNGGFVAFGSDPKGVSTEDQVSTVKPDEGTNKLKVSTVKPDEGIDKPKVSNVKPEVSTDKLDEGTTEPKDGTLDERTAPTTIFRDDKTIAVRFLAQLRAAAIRKQDTTKTQLRNQMMTYLKHGGGKKHGNLKNKNFEEIQVLYKEDKRSDKNFIAIGSTEDERQIKEMNEESKDPKKKRLKKRVVNETPREEDTAKVPAEQEVTEQGTKKRKSGHVNMIARKRSRPSLDDDSDDEHRKCLRIIIFDSTIDRRVLWGDLMIMFNPSDEDEFWNSQQDWNVVSWKLHGSSGVHTLMTEAGLVIHMLVEKKYPLRKKVLLQMLKLKLEFEEDNTMALELIRFVKKLVVELEPEDSDGDEKDLLVLSIHLIVYNEELAIPEQTATGKGISNPLMAGSLSKTTKPT